MLAAMACARPLSSRPCLSSLLYALRRPRHCLHTSARCLSTPKTDSGNVASSSPPVPVYQGPLSSTFRRLKIFSLSTLALSTVISPFMFIIESSLPGSARAALAGTALGTSALSTALVGWVGKPYVTQLKPLHQVLDPAKEVTAVEMVTYTFALRKRVTKVYDTSFLIPAERPFASWRLAKTMLFTNEELENKIPEDGKEETVAETSGEDGKVLGRWIVKWAVHPEHGSVVGDCRAVGKVVQVFNVHEDLLEYPIR